MKLSCLQENLNEGLSIVSRAVATRTTLPITQHVLVSTDQNRLKLSATNLEIAISTWIGAEIEEEGTITLPARLFTELVGTLPQDTIDLSSNEENQESLFTCGRITSKINGGDYKEYPPIPTIEEGTVISISSNELKNAINHVVFAAATEESRPVLTGVKIEISNDSITFAAADGFRLAVYTTNLSAPVEQDTDFIIPAKSLIEINRLIPVNDEQIQFTVTTSKNQALFRLDNVEIVSQLVQGSFPDYKQLIPESYTSSAIMTVNDFNKAIRTASIFARDGRGIVRLVLNNGDQQNTGTVTVASRAEEVGENTGVIDAEIIGNTTDSTDSDDEQSKIAFNSKYISDVLSIMQTEKVSLQISSPSSPGVLKPVGQDNYTHVVMPMFVQG